VGNREKVPKCESPPPGPLPPRDQTDGAGRKVGVLAGRLPRQALREAAESVSAVLSALAGGRPPVKPTKRIEEIRRTHPNAYHPWTEADDRRLTAMHLELVSIHERSELFGRQPSAITSRLHHLGLAAPDAATIERGNVSQW
jgi:hypothetical protein